MILQIEHPLIYRIVLETHPDRSMSGRTDPYAGLRRLRFSFFSDEPTLSRRRWSTSARGPRWLGVRALRWAKL
jgi:hypothetical protein